jgi:hypothetical protein
LATGSGHFGTVRPTKNSTEMDELGQQLAFFELFEGKSLDVIQGV